VGGHLGVVADAWSGPVGEAFLEVGVVHAGDGEEEQVGMEAVVAHPKKGLHLGVDQAGGVAEAAMVPDPGVGPTQWGHTGRQVVWEAL
jgi:hypothetical protein